MALALAAAALFPDAVVLFAPAAAAALLAAAPALLVLFAPAAAPAPLAAPPADASFRLNTQLKCWNPFLSRNNTHCLVATVLSVAFLVSRFTTAKFIVLLEALGNSRRGDSQRDDDSEER